MYHALCRYYLNHSLETLPVSITITCAQRRQSHRNGTMFLNAIHPSSFQSYSHISSHGVECIHTTSCGHSLPPPNLTLSALVGRMHLKKSHIARYCGLLLDPSPLSLLHLPMMSLHCRCRYILMLQRKTLHLSFLLTFSPKVSIG